MAEQQLILNTGYFTEANKGSTICVLFEDSHRGSSTAMFKHSTTEGALAMTLGYLADVFTTLADNPDEWYSSIQIILGVHGTNRNLKLVLEKIVNSIPALAGLDPSLLPLAIKGRAMRANRSKGPSFDQQVRLMTAIMRLVSVPNKAVDVIVETRLKDGLAAAQALARAHFDEQCANSIHSISSIG